VLTICFLATCLILPTERLLGFGTDGDGVRVAARDAVGSPLLQKR